MSNKNCHFGYKVLNTWDPDPQNQMPPHPKRPETAQPKCPWPVTPQVSESFAKSTLEGLLYVSSRVEPYRTGGRGQLPALRNAFVCGCEFLRIGLATRGESQMAKKSFGVSDVHHPSSWISSQNSKTAIYCNRFFRRKHLHQKKIVSLEGTSLFLLCGFVWMLGPEL